MSRRILKDFASECERKRKELSDELTQELSYAFNGNTKTSIELEGTTSWGKYAAFVLPNLLLLVPGIGWGARIAIGVGSAIFSFLFEDKEAKIREDLSALSYEVLGNMHNQVIEIFNKEILAKGIDEFHDLFYGYQFMLARLGKSQGDLANTLFWKFSDLNAKLFTEAIEYKRAANMVLVVNKMDRTALGNVSEQQQVIYEDLKKVTKPYDPKELYLSFVDTASYFKAQEETDERRKNRRLERSGREVFIKSETNLKNYEQSSFVQQVQLKFSTRFLEKNKSRRESNG